MAQSPRRPVVRRLVCHDSRYKALTPCRKTRPADRQPSLAGNDWYPKKSVSAPPALAFPPQWIAQLVELVEMAVLEAQLSWSEQHGHSRQVRAPLPRQRF